MARQKMLTRLLLVCLSAAALAGCDKLQSTPTQPAHANQTLDPSMYGISERAAQVAQTHKELLGDIAGLRTIVAGSNLSPTDSADLKMIVDQSLDTDRMYVNTYKQLQHDRQNLTPLTLMFITGDVPPMAGLGATVECLSITTPQSADFKSRLLTIYLPGRLKGDREEVDETNSLFHTLDLGQLNQPERRFLEHEMAGLQTASKLLQAAPMLLQAQDALAADNKLVLAELLIGRAHWEVRMFKFANTPDERALILAGAT
jgi:hypothetical protein